MEMGDNDNGGGFGFGLLFDMSGLGLVGSLFMIALVVGIWWCNAQATEKEYRRFCTEVCSQYHNEPVIEGSQCYCRDEQGIYDPATPRPATEAP